MLNNKEYIINESRHRGLKGYLKEDIKPHLNYDMYVIETCRLTLHMNTVGGFPCKSNFTHYQKRIHQDKYKFRLS